jgi:phage baseplate assembly protein gpV
MSMELLEALTRIAEVERKIDNLFRHGPVTERKKIDGRWFVRMRVGGQDTDPFLSPWIPYVSPNGGPQGLNVHRVPKEGEQLTLLSPAGDFQQGVATSLFWSNQHPPPSDDPDAVVITHPKFKLTLKDGVLKIDTSEKIEFNSTQEIKFEVGGSTLTMDTSKITSVVGGSALLVEGGKIRATASRIETDGKTYLGKPTAQKKVIIQGLLECEDVFAEPPGQMDEKAKDIEAQVQAAMAAAAAAGGDGGGA